MIGLMHNHLSGRSGKLVGATFVVDYAIICLNLLVRSSDLLMIRRSEVKLILTLFIRSVKIDRNHFHPHIILLIIWMVVI